MTGSDGASTPTTTSTIDDDEMDRMEAAAERHNPPARLEKITGQNWRAN